MKSDGIFNRSVAGIFYPMSEQQRLDNAEVQTILEMSLEERYYNNPAFKNLADILHHHRLMSGPACHQCMEIVAFREHLP